MTKVIISREGLENLKKELHLLKTVRRKEIAERIKRALEQGDLTENAEYAQAKEEQAFIEGKILELENKIKQAEVIDEFPKVANKVGIGSKITVQFNSLKTFYQIVGSSEAAPSEGKISNESPAGQAFLGHKVGDIVEVKTPGGKVKYKILKIE
jgi:transcription elongation factor GreA